MFDYLMYPTDTLQFNSKMYSLFQERIITFRASQMIRLVLREPSVHVNTGKLVGDAHPDKNRSAG